MNLIDLHCDTLMNCLLKGWNLKENPGHLDIGKLQAGGVLAQCMAIFIPTHDAAKESGVTMNAYEYFNAAYDVYLKELAANQDTLSPVFCYEDIEKNRLAGKISSILTVEDGVALEGRMERLEEFYRKGVRMIALTWNYENCFGFPNSRDPEIMGQGLKPFGIDALRRMNELGIIIDVSHLSEGGFFDVALYSRKPFVASHSCAHALCDHSRNLTDKQLRTLADKGGIVGINFNAPFLNVNGSHTSIDDVVRHLEYIRDKAGIEALALGSDFDGIDCTLEFENYAGLPRLMAALERNFTPSEIDLISSKNALRVLKECL